MSADLRGLLLAAYRELTSVAADPEDDVAELFADTALRAVESEVERLTRERDDALALLADVVVKAAEFGEQDGGFVAHYLLPTGPLHRAIARLDQYGITVRPGFDGRKETQWILPEVREAATPEEIAAIRRVEAAFASGGVRTAAVDTAAVISLADLCLRFGRVDRITYHADGVTPESDTDHTVMLGVIACAFAARHLPHLDVGLVAQMALVHDLVEVYAGDTPTLRITAGGRADKAAREAAALARLRDEFGVPLPWLPKMIECYERRDTPEARYVKALDKLVPKTTHILNGGQTFAAQGIAAAEAAARYEEQLAELRGYAADFPPLFELRAELVDQVMRYAFPDCGCATTQDGDN